MPRRPSPSDETNINAARIDSSPVPVANQQIHERDIPPVALPQSAGPVNKDEPVEKLVWLVFGATGHLGRAVCIVTQARNDIVFAVGQIDVDTVTNDTMKGQNKTPSDKAKSPKDDSGDIQPKIEVNGEDDVNIHDVRVEGCKHSTVDAVCDVRDGRSVQKAVDEAIRTHGRIDVVVNASGYGVIGAIEDQDEYDIKNQIDTNFMGVYNIIQSSLSHFRERQSGRYIILSSSAGLLGVPGFAPYCASKWAVEGFVESLMYEIEPFNIRATLVPAGLAKRDEPPDPNVTMMPSWQHFQIKTPSPAYSNITSPANHVKRMVQWIQDKQITSGMKVAEMVWELGHCENPPLRLLLGQYAIESMRDKLRFTLEEIEDWKHISHVDDPSQGGASAGQDDDMMEGDGD